jgi:hypothetical protein
VGGILGGGSKVVDHSVDFGVVFVDYLGHLLYIICMGSG